LKYGGQRDAAALAVAGVASVRHIHGDAGVGERLANVHWDRYHQGRPELDHRVRGHHRHQRDPQRHRRDPLRRVRVRAGPGDHSGVGGFFGTVAAEKFSNAQAILDCGSTTVVHATVPPGRAGTTVKVTVTTMESDLTGSGPSKSSASFTYKH
jgi:hypothetical protein